MTFTSRQNAVSQRGFTLIELMVALVLGLLVVGAAGALFLQNRHVYGTTEAVNRIQENQRSAFELLTRDIREAAGNPCLRFSEVPIDMLIKAPNVAFWSRFSSGIYGQDGAGVAGTDVITIYSGSNRVFAVAQHAKPDDAITVGSKTAGLINGQALLICNADHMTAFAASGIVSGGTTIGHDSTGNCDANLQVLPENKALPPCGGLSYCFWQGTGANCPQGYGQTPAFVIVPTDAQWSVAANGRSGNSLYRTSLGNRSEIAEGITSLSLTYKVGTDSNYVNAAAVEAANAWSKVTAVHVSMTFQATQGAMTRSDTQGTNNAVLTRTLDDYIALRNHQES